MPSNSSKRSKPQNGDRPSGAFLEGEQGNHPPRAKRAAQKAVRRSHTKAELKVGGSSRTRKPPSPKNLVNISELHRRTGLDRATIVKRLSAARVRPKKQESKQMSYDLGDALRALAAGDPSGLTEAKRKKLTVQTAREVLRLQRERAELLELNEVRDVLQKIFSRLFQKITIQYWRDQKRRLHHLKTADELARAGRQDMEKIFNDLRADFTSFLGKCRPHAHSRRNMRSSVADPIFQE